MFKLFFQETKWLLLIISILIAVLLANVFYFIYKQGELERDTKGIPDQIWRIYEPIEPEGLVLKQLTETLYSLTGTVREGDCEKIVPQLPNDTPFALILESPGGSLVDGGCLASHIKLRDVITIVRDTPVLDEEGNILYEPGLINKKDNEGKVICASSCSLMFLGGDIRYLIGNVWLGIHSPRTPDDAIKNISKRALESSSYRTAAALLLLLEHLGVMDDKLRLLFIQVPATTMYWLSPSNWEEYPTLKTIATHYRDFWGETTENVFSTTQQ